MVRTLGHMYKETDSPGSPPTNLTNSCYSVAGILNLVLERKSDVKHHRSVLFYEYSSVNCVFGDQWITIYTHL